jgi:hypothetical protein
MLVRKPFQGLHYLSFSPLMSWEANPESLSGGASGGEGTEDSVEESQSQGQESGYSSFVQELLKDAPKEHVSIMEPYIKKFDAGVTRRFQDLKNQYKHYEPLGWDEETTQQMAEVYRILNEEPETLYEVLKSELGIEEEAQKTGESEIGESSQEFQGLPPEIKAQIDQQQQVLTALAQWVMDQDTRTTESQQDAELDEYLNLLKQEYGEFDDEYVLTKISNGEDGEAAVKAWQNMLQQHIEKMQQSTEHLPPAVLSSAGGGAVPQNGPQNLGSIPDKDIKNLIANVIGQTNQAGM